MTHTHSLPAEWVSVSFAPMRRLHVDVLFRRRIDPSSSVLAAREDERVEDPFIVDDADFEISVGWRN
jgi:hypothetical protein